MEQPLLDTDIYSEILRAKNASIVRTASAYRIQFGKYTLSVTTVVELVQGLQRAERIDRLPSLKEALKAEEILVLDYESAILAGQIYGKLQRTGQTIGRADPLIAGMAIRHDLRLVTGNTEHFERIVRLGFPLRLENWRGAH